jgi:uncharacterized membrane protein
MSYRKLMIASVIVTGALVCLGAVALSRLPAGTQLPIHWNVTGEPDRFAAAPYALFLPAVLSAAVSALMAVLPHIEPMQQQLAQSAGLFSTAWAGLLAFMLLLGVLLSAPAFGLVLSSTLLLVGTGLLLVVIGNALPKSRPGFFVGIRTPWTLSDPDNWVATHRFGAWTMIAAGVALVVAAMLPLPPTTRGAVVTLAILVAVVPPILFSFLYWRRSGRAGGAR